MLKPRFSLLLAAGVLVMLVASAIYAQTYPSKPIRIVTLGVGTTNDFMARLMAQGMAGHLGQQVIVENRPGGGPIVSSQIVSKAAPDGYTLLYTGASHWLVTLFEKDVPFDPLKDFTPISMTSLGTNVLFVHPSLPARSVKELIGLAKAKPGQLNFSTGGTGGSTHLGAELFKAMTGVNMVRVVYPSGAVELADLLSGQMQLTFGPGLFYPYVKEGKLRALAVTSAQPSAVFPGLPPIAATVPGYESVGYFGMMAPPKTPLAIISRLNQEIVRVVNQPKVKEAFVTAGYDTLGTSPEAYAAKITSELDKWTKVISKGNVGVN